MLLKQHLPEVDEMIDKLAEAYRPIVAAIEGHSPLTKGHYDEYITAIDRLANMISGGKAPNVYLAVGLALTRAGADRAGVGAALRAMGYLQ